MTSQFESPAKIKGQKIAAEPLFRACFGLQRGDRKCECNDALKAACRAGKGIDLKRRRTPVALCNARCYGFFRASVNEQSGNITLQRGFLADYPRPIRLTWPTAWQEQLAAAQYKFDMADVAIFDKQLAFDLMQPLLAKLRFSRVVLEIANLAMSLISICEFWHWTLRGSGRFVLNHGHVPEWSVRPY